MAKLEKANSIGEWFDQRLATKKLAKVMFTEYWIPKDINFLWAMGVVLVVMFKMLIISGIFLLMYYKPDVDLAFDSVNFTIMQEVEYGWLWRHIHAVAASMAFLTIYIHMFTAIYYGSYKQGREMIWITGMLLFILFSTTAFTGYVLPWGQMSFWAAQVITNLFAGVPFVGDELVIWIRGDYAVADATLTRFFMLHVFLLPLLIVFVIVLHFYSLRIPHVNNQEGEDIDFDKESQKYLEGNKKESKVVPFWPVFLAKDFYIVSVFMTIFFFFVFFYYDFSMPGVNFEPANPMVTPKYIYPEWYFLWSYEVLRGFFFDVGPIKAMDIGLIAFAFANVIFVILPFLDKDPRILPAHKRPRFKIWFWVLMFTMVILTIYGKLPPKGFNNVVGFISAMTFITLFLILPYITKKDAGGAK